MDDASAEPRLAAWEERTDVALTVLAAAYLAVYAVQVLATRAPATSWRVLDVVLWGVWGVFVLDFAVRLVLARHRWRFLLRHPIDLLVALAPFLRFLRLLRLLAAVSTLGRVLRDDFRGRVGVYLVATVSLLGFVAALGVYEAERDVPEASIATFGDAVWWVLTTITTVGYGDRYPVTTEGRLVAAGLMVAGIAVLGTVTAAIASWFLERVGASDPAEAVPDDAEGADVPSTPATAAQVAELLGEVRALRTRLDALEVSAPAPTAPRAGELKGGHVGLVDERRGQARGTSPTP